MGYLNISRFLAVLGALAIATTARAAMTFSNTQITAGTGTQYPAGQFTSSNSTAPNFIHIGSAVSITGAQYLNGTNFIIYQGDLTGSSGFTTGRLITTSSVHADYTGGSLAVQYMQTSSGAVTGISNQIPMNPATPLASGQTINTSYPSTGMSFGSQPGPTWIWQLAFSWTGQSPTDTLSLSLPSTDIVVAPEPASAALMGAVSLLVLRRRG
jgi:hypothetical protein